MRRVHRLLAYCALLAMICQLLLPFAHAALMAQNVSVAWCGTGAKPVAQLMLDASQSQQDDQPAKMMFCSVCATASIHAIAPPPAVLILPLAQTAIVVEFAPDHAEFSFPSYAIPPPPRGPPLIS